MRRIFILLLLLLIGTASAVPLLPAEFWGSVTIDGAPAPAGTVIIARIDGRDCGSLTLDVAGVYGGDAIFDKRLLVSGEADDKEKEIIFFVNDVKAIETSVYTPGTSKRLDLSITEGADFSADVTCGVAPLTVRFSAESTGNMKPWFWTFGDGGTSTAQNPMHTYKTPGNYTVNLSVEGEICTKSGYIKVTPVLFGDANDDNVVDQADTLLVLKQVVGAVEPGTIPEPGTEKFQKIDVNQNGVIDVGDALFIAQYNVGLRDVWLELL
ncbi:MAG: PKD domain-containing protein [Methanomicrobiales archaeon]|nr:PKD domain-containing protein [Methanomicrobiales archaeon]